MFSVNCKGFVAELSVCRGTNNIHLCSRTPHTACSDQHSFNVQRVSIVIHRTLWCTALYAHWQCAASDSFDTARQRAVHEIPRTRFHASFPAVCGPSVAELRVIVEIKRKYIKLWSDPSTRSETLNWYRQCILWLHDAVLKPSHWQTSTFSASLLMQITKNRHSWCVCYLDCIAFC